MLNDVTFGQFYPAKSFVHNMDARAKIVFVIAYIVAIFLADNFIALVAVTLFLIFVVLLSRVPFGSVLRSVKMILFLIVFTAILNLFFYSGESAYSRSWTGGSSPSRRNLWSTWRFWRSGSFFW